MTLYAGTIVDTPGDPFASFAGDPGDALAEVGARALVARMLSSATSACR